MPTVWLEVPYYYRESKYTCVKVLDIDTLTPEIRHRGGEWSEAQFDPWRAVVRVRHPSSAFLRQLGKRYTVLSETEAVVRHSPHTTLETVVARVPETPASVEWQQLIARWKAVGFGLGFRLPLSEILRGARTGYAPLWGAAFPTTSVLDDFNRADSGSLGSNWSVSYYLAGSTPHGIASNQCAVPSGTFHYPREYYNVSTYGPDSEAFYTLVTVIADGEDACIVGLRQKEAGSGTHDDYHFDLGAMSAGTDTSLRLVRTDNGSGSGGRTQLGASFSQAVTNGYKYGIEAIGSDITAYTDTGGGWASMATRSDSTYTAAGNLNLTAPYGGSGNFNVVDDFGGGTVVNAHSPSVNEAVTMAESVVMHMPISLKMQKLS